MSRFIQQDEIFLFNEGTFHHCYLKMGAHKVKLNGIWGVHFAVWAPNASVVKVVGNFNNWQGHGHIMERGSGGIWVLFAPFLDRGEVYKYEITTSRGEQLLKADPFAFHAEKRPKTASVVYPLEGYSWGDGQWMADRGGKDTQGKPFNIYEVHLGSWKRKHDGDFYSYRELAGELIPYVKELGFTHLELLPLMEHPYDGSWGYQGTGYYAATSRFGTPHDLMYFIDQCHQAGLGVILDWVPGHFCKDAHGLGRFDGTPLFEGGEHDEWGTYEFDFSRPEVRSFLIGNAVFWLDQFHIDGLRADGITSMLFLDYGKRNGSWKPNVYGGRENLEAIAFLRTLNRVIKEYHPGVSMIAEESTEWAGVTKSVEDGGLGFDYKWNMGWMNDTLEYMGTDFDWRQEKHNTLTFSLIYAFAENFILPLSHDEVVHGKKSLIGRLPGDYWRQFAGLRALYCYQICHPGKKLFFMGGEFAQFIEWRYYEELEWFLLDYPMHRMFKHFVATANRIYMEEKSLWELDNSWKGFEWIDVDNRRQSIFIFQRKAKSGEPVIVILNLKPDYYPAFRLGVPVLGEYKEILNSDSPSFGGSGKVNDTTLSAELKPWHGQRYSLVVKLPPLGGVLLKPVPTYK
ncbi:MAG TPA: 1,4-alpha-glucan branching protein GlgB [Clostridia bacterium]|nr:1,4-alpha-glucan branching protein GlgB [Clostridia bacterium]